MYKKKEKEPLDLKGAKEKALRLLEYRSHSEKELSDKLRRQGADEEDIASVMDFLKEYRLIDDRIYASRLAADMRNIKKYGKKRIANELSLKGIAKDIITDITDNMPDDDTDEMCIMISKRLKGDFDKKNKDKVIRYFLYRGYKYEDIARCIEKIEEEEENGI